MEGRKRLFLRVGMVAGLLTSTAATGYWGYRTFTKPKGTTVAANPADPTAATTEGSGIPAAPSAS